MQSVVVNELEFDLILSENHPEFELIDEPEFIEEWRHGITYHQMVKRLEDGALFNMTYRKDIKNEEFYLIGGSDENEIVMSYSKKSIYNRNGEILTHDHPPKPKPKTEFELLKEEFEQIPKEDIKRFPEEPVIPTNILFNALKRFNKLKTGLDFQQYQKDVYRLGIDYKINPELIHRFSLDYRQSKAKQAMKNDYNHRYESLKNGHVKITLKSGKHLELTLDEIKELKKKL